MKMLLATTPAVVREEIVQYLEWRARGQENDYANAKTRRDKLAHYTAFLTLNSIIADIRECVLLTNPDGTFDTKEKA